MGPARWRFFVSPRGPRGATRFVSKDSALPPIVAARDDVTAGDMEASCQAAKKTKIETTEPLELASTELRESVCLTTATRERWRAFITVAREPKKTRRGTLAREETPILQVCSSKTLRSTSQLAQK